jgi:hypothetical protein
MGAKLPFMTTLANGRVGPTADRLLFDGGLE